MIRFDSFPSSKRRYEERTRTTHVTIELRGFSDRNGREVANLDTNTCLAIQLRCCSTARMYVTWLLPYLRCPSVCQWRHHMHLKSSVMEGTDTERLTDETEIQIQRIKDTADAASFTVPSKNWLNSGPNRRFLASKDLTTVHRAKDIISSEGSRMSLVEMIDVMRTWCTIVAQLTCERIYTYRIFSH